MWWEYSALEENINSVGMQLVENDGKGGNLLGAWKAQSELCKGSANTVEKQKVEIKRVTQGHKMKQQESKKIGLTRLKFQLTAEPISQDWFPFRFGI